MIHSTQTEGGSPRDRRAGEITPKSVSHSRTYQYNDTYHAAHFATDLDLSTHAWTQAAADDRSWFHISLDRIYCIREIEWLNDAAKPHLTWTCTNKDCTSCEGSNCPKFDIKVGAGRSLPDYLPKYSDCRYGDAVFLEKVSPGKKIVIAEILVIEAHGI